MTRSLWLLLALCLASPASAQGTAADSAHWRATKLDLDSLARDKSAPGYAKRAEARIRTRDSLRTVVVTPLPPPPTPDTTVIVVKPDTTPAPPPVVVKPVVLAHPFPAPANGAKLAELPRDTVSVAPLPITRTINATNLQAALDTARVGDLLLAPADAVAKNVIVRRSGVTVRTAGFTATDARMTPTQAAALRFATITTASTDPALTIANGVRDIRLEGIRVTAGFSGVTALVVVGTQQADTALIPKRVVFKNVVIDCGATNDTRRGMRFDAASEAFVDGSIVNCHSNNSDSQGILVINSPGPIRIENSRIEGGHMAIMLGGGDPAVQGQIPRDFVIRRNSLCRPIAWQNVWQTKVILELKFGQRGLIEGNRLCNSWPSGQTGYAFNLKSTNQDGTAPWSNTSDITVRWNRITCASGVFSLAGNPDADRGTQFNAIPMSRVTIYGNVADSIGTAPCQGSVQGAVMVAGVDDAVLRDNWMRDPSLNSAIYMINPSQRFVATGNTFGGEYGIRGEGGLSLTAPGSIITGNNLVPWGTSFASWPATPADSVRDALLAGVPLGGPARARSQIIIKRGAKE